MSVQSATVSERIHGSMDTLSAAERRAARTLLADYPASGLGPSQALASAAGVSAPTVVRLAVRLGFAGFSDMQDRLRAEVSDGASSPVLRAMARQTGHRRRTPFAQAMQRRRETIDATLRLVPASELDSAIRLIAECPKDVLVIGGFFSGAIAQILTLQLSQARSNVIFVEEPLRRGAGLVLDAKKGSLCIIFDLRRYEANSHALAKQAKSAGIDVLLVTDRWMSPIAATADVVLPVEVEAVPFDTFVAVLAVTEIIVEAVIAQLGSKSLRRMKQWENNAVEHTRRGRPE